MRVAITSKYSSVFYGVGKLNSYKLNVHINPNVPPVAQPPRRVPVHIRKAVDKKLKELEELDIIESLVGPTPGSLPLWLYLKPMVMYVFALTCAVIRERHPIPTLGETVQALNCQQSSQS